MSPKILARLTVALVLGALAAVVPVAMAAPGDHQVGTLTINGVTGGGSYNSNGSGPTGVIDVYGYSLSIRRPSSLGSSGGGGVGKATPSELSIVKRADQATPGLYADVARGRLYSGAKLSLADGNGGSPYLTYCFTSLQPVADHQYNTGDDAPANGQSGVLAEGLSLKFSKVSITFSGPFQSSDISQGFDFSKNVPVTGGCPSGRNYGGGGLRPNRR
jgi:type VI protein secretion system component Hcp